MLLCEAPSGCRARITDYGGRDQRHKLLALGLTPSRPFTLRNPGHCDNRVLDCGGCTIAVNASLAKSVQVQVLN